MNILNLFKKKELSSSKINFDANFYQGSRSSRLTNNWATFTESADTSLDCELETLRNRSRDLNRNNAVASGITNTIVDNVIHTGIKPQASINYQQVGIDEKKAADLEKQAEQIWAKFVPEASANGMMNFYELQKLAVRQIVESGEFLAVRRAIKNKTRHFLIALDVIEPDRLASRTGRTSENEKYGVLKNQYGQPISYSIRKTHPGDSFSAVTGGDLFVNINALDLRGQKQVFHIFNMLRPGQTRGVPFFAPVMEQFKILADYIEAELVAARVSACYAGFVKTDFSYQSAVSRAAETVDNQRIESLEPGILEYLGPGQDIVFSDPKRPGTTFDQFVERILRIIGAALQLPYELVLKDFSKTNYSSARAALLQSYRTFQGLQALIINNLCQPVYEQVLREAWLKSDFEAPNFEKYAWEYTRVNWINPGWQWVDPLKEVNSASEAVKMGFKTRADVCAEYGQDWEAKAEQSAREKRKYEELGLSLGTETPANQQNSGKNEDELPREEE